MKLNTSILTYVIIILQTQSVQCRLLCTPSVKTISRSVGHNFLKGREVSLPCSYRRTCYHHKTLMKISIAIRSYESSSRPLPSLIPLTYSIAYSLFLSQLQLIHFFVFKVSELGGIRLPERVFLCQVCKALDLFLNEHAKTHFYSHLYKYSSP